MRKIRVLIVDDAVVVRRIVSEVLVGDPDIEVAGIAANGRIALTKIPQVNPDLVTLDIEMPEMDGLETLREIRKIYPTLPVIMFSTLTSRGASATLDALAFGANDYVTKPANVGSVSMAMQRIREELIPRIKTFCAKAVGLRQPLEPKPAAKPKVQTPFLKPSVISQRVETSPVVSNRVDIVAIGVSTGGPNALAELFPHLPSNFPVPIVIVQHMPPFFTKLLAERLDTKSQVSISEGRSGEQLQPGAAYIAPGDYHMVLEKNGNGVLQIQTNQNPPENSCRPAVDVLFRSVAKFFGPHCLGIILTGMGQDGLIGCEHIKETGGQIVVQDEETSVVWGMPGFVARSGLAEKIIPLPQMQREIVSRLKHGRSDWSPAS
ncbi:MAG: chemotaxis response regulator protein-glutamate methylesterase [Nitrospinales bacterium]